MSTLSVDRSEIKDWYRGFQSRFAAGIEHLDDEKRFVSDVWERTGGGGGDTRILTDGLRIEKAAVNFSAVWGDTPSRLSEQMAAAGKTFYATGVSIIVHPRNPHAPTFHANIRYFETDIGTAWFGGGADLTPHYLYEEDARHFHQVLKDTCDRNPVADHATWKRACDEYFYLQHRKEARGVGGIFFDHLTDRPDEVWAFQRDLGDSLLDAYFPILERRVGTAFNDEEVAWQRIRRGRYVEFNLVWDRGTRFGLETSGRTESILGSLPPSARWEYCHEPPPGSREAELLDTLRSPARDWI